jgi:Holliday junction resolvase RusA-like endonuclease
MTYTLEFSLDGLPKMVLNGSHSSYRAINAERRKWKDKVGDAVKGKEPEAPLKLARLVIIRHASVEPDLDNCFASAKPIVDGLVEAGILEDDKISNFVEYKCEWKKAKPKEGKITVKVEAA